MADELALIV
jgi:hypothetical protein